MRRLLFSLCCALLALTAQAEQMQQFGPWQFHYIVLPTTFLQASTAERYDIARGDDRALINVSLIHTEHGPTPATVAGTYTNLLSQSRDLTFREVREGDAVYYLAEIKHTDRDILRFALQAVPSGESQALDLSFQQRMYVERDRQ